MMSILYRLPLLCLLLSVMMFTALPAMAQDKLESEPQPSGFFAKCMLMPDETLDAEAQEEFCACLDAQRVSIEGEDFGLSAKERLYVRIYGPCIYIPVRESTYDDCYYNPYFQREAGGIANLEKMCGCLTDRVTEYVKESGDLLVASGLERQPHLDDPIAMLEENTVYHRERSYIRQECVDHWNVRP